MRIYADGLWSWNLIWRRKLLQYEEQSLIELLALLEHVHLQENRQDFMSWSNCNNVIYSVKSGREVLDANTLPDVNDLLNSLWKVKIPSKPPRHQRIASQVAPIESRLPISNKVNPWLLLHLHVTHGFFFASHGHATRFLPFI
ncbi:hypothetical protein ACFE04_014204 [Oxalis oulophora]